MASHVIGPFLVASEPLDDYELDLLEAASEWSFLTLFADGSFSGMVAIETIQSATLTMQPVMSGTLTVTGAP